MELVKNDNCPTINAWVHTTQIHSNSEVYFGIGSFVKIIRISEHGYDIQDTDGNVIKEVGWII